MRGSANDLTAGWIHGMKFVAFSHDGIPGTGLLRAGGVHGRLQSDAQYPGDLDEWVREDNGRERYVSAFSHAPTFPLTSIQFRPPFVRPNKILCVGLNYRDHTAESGYQQPGYPTLFARFTTTLVAHMAPIVRQKE